MKKIVLWGAGKLGKYLLKSPSKLYDVVGVIDNEADVLETVTDGKNIIPVWLPTEFASFGSEEIYGVLIAVLNDFAVADIMKQMREMGVRRAGVIRKNPSFDESNWDNIVWLDLDKQSFLPYLEVGISDVCNLKCKGCTHFANLFTPENDQGESVEELEEELKLLSEHVFIKRLRILGGEPFLNPKIEEYLQMSRRMLPDTEIRVVTNGLLLLNSSASIYESLRKNGIGLDITAYPPVIKKKEAIIQCLEQNGVDFKFTEEVHQFYRMLTKEPQNHPEKSYKNCNMSVCKMLRHGKIYRCPMEGMLYKYIEHYNLDNFILYEKEQGVDFLEKKIDWKNLYQLLEGPMNLCRHCNENGGELFDWEVSANPKKEEWLISGK